MFSYLEGVIDERGTDSLVLDVKGVGYELFASSKTLGAVEQGEKRRLYVHLHIAEGILALYGFATREEKLMFRQLISISRVGPKLAVTALGHLTVSELATAIVLGDDQSLSRVPGLGKKTAQRVILELKEKLSSQMDSLPTASSETGLGIEGGNKEQEAIAALVALGYDGTTAIRAVKAAGEQETVEKLVAAALRALAH